MSDKRKASSGGWFAAGCWAIDRAARWGLKALGLYRDAKEARVATPKAAVVVKKTVVAGGWFWRTLAAGCWAIDRFVRRGLEVFRFYRDVQEAVEVIVPAAIVVKKTLVTVTTVSIGKACSTLKAVGISWSSLCALQSATLTAFAVGLTIAGGISLILVVGVLSTALRT